MKYRHTKFQPFLRTFYFFTFGHFWSHSTHSYQPGVDTNWVLLPNSDILTNGSVENESLGLSLKWKFLVSLNKT